MNEQSHPTHVQLASRIVELVTGRGIRLSEADKTIEINAVLRLAAEINEAARRHAGPTRAECLQTIQEMIDAARTLSKGRQWLHDHGLAADVDGALGWEGTRTAPWIGLERVQKTLRDNAAPFRLHRGPARAAGVEKYPSPQLMLATAIRNLARRLGGRIDPRAKTTREAAELMVKLADLRIGMPALEYFERAAKAEKPGAPADVEAASARVYVTGILDALPKRPKKA